MNVTDCLLVGFEARSRARVQGVARLTFPYSQITSFDSVAEILARPTGFGGELLVLENPDEVALAQANEAIDSSALRRWAIVVVGASVPGPGVEVVSPADFSEPLMAHALRSAAAQQHLIRLLQRTQGDLRTVAQRISHDMRTPLGGIISAAEVIKESSAEHDATTGSLVVPILTSADEISRIVERVSYLLKASAQPIEKKTVAMMEPVWAAMQRVERQAVQKGATISQPESWPEVGGVGKMLEVIWTNLLTNALQHAGTAPKISLGWSKDADRWKFWVRDNGPGVSPLIQAKLFQPFNTLYETNASRGLGLSMTQRLVELQGGECGYQPVTDGGSQFFFFLPNT